MSRDITPSFQRTGVLSPGRSITPPPIRSNPLDVLIPKKAPGSSASAGGVRFTWATVTAAYPDPVQILIDTESEPLQGSPEMLCTVGIGDRVLVAIANKQAVVLGVGTPDQSGGTPLIQSGAVIITPSAANTPTPVTVSFDEEFANVPFVVATAYTTAPGTVVTGVSVSATTTTTAELTLTRTDTTPTRVNWIAMQG